jgi:hypothetical protein
MFFSGVLSVLLFKALQALMREGGKKRPQRPPKIRETPPFRWSGLVIVVDLGGTFCPAGGTLWGTFPQIGGTFFSAHRIGPLVRTDLTPR